MKLKIIIAGDFFISDDYEGRDLIDDSVLARFEEADYRIVNLEAPLTAEEPANKILKTGPHLRTSAETIAPYLKQLNVDLVTLANNHILDYGNKGLRDTFECLKANKFAHVGAGDNLQEAAKPFTLKKDELKIAILNFAENEWSIAEPDKPGANPLDIIDNVRKIKAAKSTHDKVICIIHGGHIGYKLPSPGMVKQYRFYAECGADVIVAHHTHCIGGYELYEEVPIFYGLGSFLFTRHKNNEDWYTGLLLRLDINKSNNVCFEIIPFQQDCKTFNCRILNGEEKSVVTEKVCQINKTISNEKELERQWQLFAKKDSKQILNQLSPLNAIPSRHLKSGLRRLGIDKTFMNSHYLNSFLNLVRCEAHLEKTITFLKNNLHK